MDLMNLEIGKDFRNMYQDTTKQPLPRLLVSPREAARMLAVSERTLFSLRKAGAIPAVQVGRCVRYSLDDLRRWIEGHSQRISPE